jgi:transcriptional regulator
MEQGHPRRQYQAGLIDPAPNGPCRGIIAFAFLTPDWRQRHRCGALPRLTSSRPALHQVGGGSLSAARRAKERTRQMTSVLASRERFCSPRDRPRGDRAMYRPEHFAVEDVPSMHALLRARPFATLVSSGASGLFASHLPTVLRDAKPFGVIECHLARANPHWRDLAEGNEALMIFQGPQGYITPNWYPSKAQHGKVVPTWNFAVVHAYGRPEVMADEAWLRDHVGELTAQQERSQARPWAISDAPKRYIDGMLRGIVGFRFAITRLEGKWKMSQNREDMDRVGVAAGLGDRAGEDDLAMADLVSRPPKGTV